MKQARLALGKEKGTLLQKAKDYEAGNTRAAKVILEERQRYQRECPYLVKWAEDFQRRAQTGGQQ